MKVIELREVDVHYCDICYNEINCNFTSIKDKGKLIEFCSDECKETHFKRKQDESN